MKHLSIAVVISLLLAACSTSGEAEITDEPTEAASATESATDAPTPTDTPTEFPTEAATEAATVEPTEAPHAALFQMQGDDPVVPHGGFDSNTTTFSGPIVFHGGMYYEFYTAFAEVQGGASRIGLATSPDGVTWTALPNVLFSSDYLPDREGWYAAASGVVVEDNGTWTLYLSAWEPRRGGKGYIYRATAAEPDGSWAIDDAPVLSPGDEGDWDDQSVQSGYVVHQADGYLMYYQGSALYSRTYPSSIGLATSDDGITWTKHDDPATTEKPYAHSDPVLLPQAETWEADGLGEPDVQRYGDGFVMLYNAIQESGERAFGLAFSEDGMTWQRDSHNPVLTEEDVPEALFLHSAHIGCEANQCLMLIELFSSMGGFSDLWLAQSGEQLAP